MYYLIIKYEVKDISVTGKEGGSEILCCKVLALHVKWQNAT